MKQHEFLQPRKGFEDFVELFGSLTIGDWDGEYFVSWREAYRSETIYRRRVIIELDCQFRVYLTFSAYPFGKTWRQIFMEETEYKEICTTKFPDVVKLPGEPWSEVFYDANHPVAETEDENDDDDENGYWTTDDDDESFTIDEDEESLAADEADQDGDSKADEVEVGEADIDGDGIGHEEEVVKAD